MDFPFDPKRALFDEEAFHVLREYFELRPGFADNPEGYGAFLFDFNRLQGRDIPDILRVSPYLFVFGQFAFPRDDFSPTQCIQLLRDRGIGCKEYLDAMMDFNFSPLGEFSASVVGTIASFLDPSFSSNPGLLFYEYKSYQDRFSAQQELCARYNGEQENPLSLDFVLDVEESPIALRHAADGSLYVLDEAGILHQFRGEDKIKEWSLDRDFRAGSFHDSLVILPNIMVVGDILYVTSKTELLSFNLAEREVFPRPLEMVIHNDNALHRRDESSLLYHDVLVQDGVILVSVSETVRDYAFGLERSIVQVLPSGSRVAYKGPYPVRNMKTNFDDHTLRLGLFNGDLYFPESTGISALAPEGAREMLRNYVKPDTNVGAMQTPTKFTFSSKMMIAAVVFNEGQSLPMLSFFTPVYDANSPALVASGQAPYPSRFDLRYVTSLPKITGASIVESSFSAFADSFAYSHPLFKKVFLYRLSGSKI
ncbi:TPA: hypothetical protein HA241_00680 [Candidatus Woesearchaeota archaeon]|nr:hypothetical protein [Candidatus Woesearchaeota archaeon]